LAYEVVIAATPPAAVRIVSHSFREGCAGNQETTSEEVTTLAKDHGSSVKDDKQYEGLRKKGMSKERAAKIANTPGASKKGGKKQTGGGGGGGGGKQGQRKGGKKSS
jgi:hypothetical protein